MYRLRWYCCAILNGGRFGDLRIIYQGCRALPFALAGLSCKVGVSINVLVVIPENCQWGFCPTLQWSSQECVWGQAARRRRSRDRDAEGVEGREGEGLSSCPANCGVWGTLWVPPAGSRAEPQWKNSFGAFSTWKNTSDGTLGLVQSLWAVKSLVGWGSNLCPVGVLSCCFSLDRGTIDVFSYTL